MKTNSLLVSSILALLCSVVLGFAPATAQNYTYVPTNKSSEKWEPYHSFYDGNVNQYHQMGYFWWYDYGTPFYSEWVVPASDMKAAGLCPGPIDAMSLQFAYNRYQFNGRVRIFMNALPATRYTLPYHYNNPPGTIYYPDYYLYGVKNTGSKVNGNPNGALKPADGAVEVYDNPNFILPVIGQGDTTWIDFEYNKDTFVWDGTSNILIGFMRCTSPNTAYNYIINGTGMMFESTDPPAGYGYQNTGYFPTNGTYWYAQNNPNLTCDDGGYYYYQDYVQIYNYGNGTYKNQEVRPALRVRAGGGATASFPDDIDPRRILRAGDNYNGSA